MSRWLMSFRQRYRSAGAHTLDCDTLRSAPGLISTRLYRGRGNGIVYLLLTTWEDEQSWLKAQERHTPKKLLLTATNLLVSQPEQWCSTISGAIAARPPRHSLPQSIS
ncbi:antibiotic biosynthesis monooxygenase family protein [Dictyobacter formicarum]|uniref:antibiotic biosynthesis monooxygenase family protein n=1 Tax=Dictyobacter formicarum TaxID=2778368 RepID=UPI00191605DF|nr:antibiotic biosynthesis monooxygenase [Dictyobacter formicarum]